MVSMILTSSLELGKPSVDVGRAYAIPIPSFCNAVTFSRLRLVQVKSLKWTFQENRPPP
jgi:hypothetical protein